MIYLPMATVRPATVDDCEFIQAMITELAVFEEAPEQVLDCVTTTPAWQLLSHAAPWTKVKMTAEKLRKDGFGPTPRFHSLIGELDGVPVAYAIYFFVYSTWEGLSLYLEDVYVQEAARGKGLGMALMKAVGSEMLANDCARFQWFARC